MCCQQKVFFLLIGLSKAGSEQRFLTWKKLESTATDALCHSDGGIESTSSASLEFPDTSDKEGQKKGTFHLFHSWLWKVSTMLMVSVALMVQGSKDPNCF